MSNLSKGAPSNQFGEDIPRKDYANSKNKLYAFNMDFDKMPKENEVFWKTHGKYDATCKNCGTRREFGGNTKTALQCPTCGAGYNPKTKKRAEYQKTDLVDLDDNKWSGHVISKGKEMRDLEMEEDSEEKDSAELTAKEAARKSKEAKKHKEADSKAASSLDVFLKGLDTNDEPPPKKAAKKAEAKPAAKKSVTAPKKAAAVKTTKSSDDNLGFIELDKNISVGELMDLIKSNSDGSSRIIMVERGDILSYGDKLYIVQ